MRRHSRSKTHLQALRELRRSCCSSGDDGVANDRNDVPCLEAFYAAYKGARLGHSFLDYEAEHHPRGHRGGRRVARKIVQACAAVLREDDATLIARSTDIALTQDGRAGFVVSHGRLTMGTGLPSGLVRAEELVELVDGGAVPARGGDDPASLLPSGVHHVRGQGIVSVDRLLGFRKQDPYETTADLAEHLADSLRQAAGSEGAWEDARRKVHVFCPDGAADEQLAGRLSSEFFPNLFFVLRCAAHSVHGCLRDAWRADTEVQRLTKNVVEEVAKFLRHSPRFQLRFGARQQGEIMEAVQNFNFAPQRFGSRAGSLGRFVLFIRPVMEVLADEVENPSSAARRAWALRIVHEMTSDNLHLLGMLADFAADCVSFLRRFDRRDIDPFSSAMAVQGYLTFLKRAYQQHQMWRTPGTFAKHIATILAEGGVLVVRDDTLVLEKPNREAQIRSMARLGNVAEAFVACLKAEFPRFSVQRLLGCFLVPSGVGPGDESAGGVGPGGGPPGAGGPAPTAVNQLRRLARYLQMDPAREEQLVAEFRTYYPRVVRRCASGECAPRDAWALELAAPANENELRPILRMMIGFFVSETECERLFSVENRRKASPMKSSARADILKIKTDGLPLSSLVIGGALSAASGFARKRSMRNCTARG